MINTILGFDARVLNSSDVTSSWDEPRRTRYLLRTDVPWVASVDTVVWPSVFEFADDLQLDLPRTGAMRLVAEDLHQQALGLWRDTSKMQQAISHALLHRTMAMQIALTVFGHDKGMIGRPFDDLLKEDTDPPILRDTWNLLGYDVATPFLLSGLSNCGYNEQEKSALTRRWSDRLNSVGLLADLDDALEFKEVTGRRVPEHAPFLVYGMYALRP